MKHAFAGLFAGFLMSSLIGAPAGAEATRINGAGATFPFPVYAKWAEAYHQETGVQMNYQSIGSGGGVKQIKAATVDFGASDAPLEPEELNRHGLMQWPQVMGGVVPVFNIPGVGAGELRLSESALAGIYLGKIGKWNDPALVALNPDLALPDMPITVVHRSDGSGTSFIFTNFLAKVSPEWKDSVGFGKAISWPTGIGGKGNEGVASYVSRIKGGIGYVEYAYALQNGLTSALMENHAGNFVAPTAETFQAAAAGADWAGAEGFYLLLTDQPGENSWPISGASFIIVHKTAQNPQNTAEVLKFFDWSYRNGAAMAEELGYVPMPQQVIDLVEQSWAAGIADPSGAPLWPVK